MARTISEKRAIDLFKTKCSGLDIEDLGFILTVIRDNAKHDNVHDFLNEALSILSDKKNN